MGCFFGCSGNNSNKKKRSENSKHNPQESSNSNHNVKDEDPTSSVAETREVAPSSDDRARTSSEADVTVEGGESAVTVNEEETREMDPSSDDDRTSTSRVEDVTVEGDAKARTFTYQELVDATENFRSEYFVGEGGFGKVFKGKLVDTTEVVAIKQLDPNGVQGIREFVVEVLTLSLADHPNLVKLIGYCAEGDQRLLVYEYMPLGSLDTHLHEVRANKKALDWNTRMMIAAGAAKGLEYLHDKMKPPVIYRDLKCSNILLGEGYNPKLSDFGLAKVGPIGDKTHVSTRVMGTYGYCAPEYAMTGQLTFRSDIYSFGVVLLEIITGRKAIYITKGGREQNLVAWARPLFKDKKLFSQMADPALQDQYPKRGLFQALAIAAMCVQERPNKRPRISEVVTSLEFLSQQKYDPEMHSSRHRRTPSSSSSIKKDFRNNSKKPETEDSQSETDLGE